MTSLPSVVQECRMKTVYSDKNSSLQFRCCGTTISFIAKIIYEFFQNKKQPEMKKLCFGVRTLQKPIGLRFHDADIEKVIEKHNINHPT